MEEESYLENYILGSEINFSVNLNKSYKDMEYEEALKLLYFDAELEAVNMPKEELIEDDKYLIPHIFDEKVVRLIPEEDEFKIGDIMSLDINYKFIIFDKEDFKDLVFSKLPINTVKMLKNWKFWGSNYSLIEYNKEDKLFNLNGKIRFQK